MISSGWVPVSNRSTAAKSPSRPSSTETSFVSLLATNASPRRVEHGAAGPDTDRNTRHLPGATLAVTNELGADDGDVTGLAVRHERVLAGANTTRMGVSPNIARFVSASVSGSSTDRRGVGVTADRCRRGVSVTRASAGGRLRVVWGVGRIMTVAAQ